MRFIAALAVLILTGCSTAASRPTTSTQVPATARPTTATSAPKPATATPAPDYRGMRNRLLEPLGALIVATRSHDTANTATFYARFNQAGDDILTAISNDMSKSANILHSTVTNVRSHPSNVAALEEDRQSLITAIP